MSNGTKANVKGILKKNSKYSSIHSPYAENSLWNLLSPRRATKKSNKTVRFTSGTVIYERETKAYKYHDLFKNDSLSKFPPEARQNTLETFLRRGTKQEIEEDDPETAVSNTYIHFTHAKRLPKDPLRKNTESLARSRRLFAMIQELQICHEEYNGDDSVIKNQEDRDTYLINEILIRYILALDLSLTEGYYGTSLELLVTIADTTGSMIPLYSHMFYNLDGTYRQLPEPRPEDISTYMPNLAPVIYALNRISENRSHTNNSGLNIETLLTKLQLELIVLTTAPIESLLFRTVLEIVPGTSTTAAEYLRNLLSASSPVLWIKWVNNSNLRNDYTGILKKTKLDGVKRLEFKTINKPLSLNLNSEQCQDQNNNNT